jgi:hypothetical protein
VVAPVSPVVSLVVSPAVAVVVVVVAAAVVDRPPEQPHPSVREAAR